MNTTLHFVTENEAKRIYEQKGKGGITLETPLAMCRPTTSVFPHNIIN